MKQSIVITTNEFANIIELQVLALDVMAYVSDQIGYIKPKPVFYTSNKKKSIEDKNLNKPLYWFFHNTEFKLVHSEEEQIEKKWFYKRENNDKNNNKIKEKIFKLHCFFDITEKNINLEKIMNKYIKMTEHNKLIKSFEIKE
ncbi:MAG: hypothetical protein CL760_11940 [Chloroflexi bacterium]|nr:hypothetical protein [Chloroflexota bacterium]|tara:strand:+ start:48411 stop:48836 length:426 start_codon:yes stop_codon:yes gene_type:complete